MVMAGSVWPNIPPTECGFGRGQATKHEAVQLAAATAAASTSCEDSGANTALSRTCI